MQYGVCVVETWLHLDIPDLTVTINGFQRVILCYCSDITVLDSCNNQIPWDKLSIIAKPQNFESGADARRVSHEWCKKHVMKVEL